MINLRVIVKRRNMMKKTAYVIALMITQFGNIFGGNANAVGVIAAIVLLGVMIYMLFRPYKESSTLETKVKV